MVDRTLVNKLLPILILSALCADAQPYPMTPEQRGAYYKSRGLSLDAPRPNTVPLAPPRDYPMRSIPITDPRFQSVYNAVLETIAAIPKGRPKIIPPATIGDFFDRLQMGDTYVIQKGEITESCPKCMGAGRIPSKEPGPRIGDGKLECKECKGIGKLTRILQLLIKW
jgi:hypothetical protein